MPEVQLLDQRFTEFLQAAIQRWPIDPEDRDKVSHRVASLGGTQIVKSAIRESCEESLLLWAHDRPDLTFEALALCPAWNDLFSEEEEVDARTRLARDRLEFENSPARRAKTWYETWVFWIDGRPIGASQGGFEDSESPSPTCEMFRRMAEIFAESGQFSASFHQRRHYRTCDDCSALISLDEVVAWLDQEWFRRLRVLLSMMPKLLRGPLLMWTFVLLAFIDSDFLDVSTEEWVAARQGLSDKPFSDFVQSLDTFEFFGLPLAKRAGHVFEPVPPGHGELLLPSELGFPSVPGVLNTSITTEEWNRLQETADEEGRGVKPGTGIFDDDRFDFCAFGFSLIEATSFQIQCYWKGPNPHVLVPNYLPFPEPPKEHVDNGPIDLAEVSLREALGSEVYNSLCGDAFIDAAAAERLYHDTDQRQGQGIIFHLVRAFEHQLTRVVMQPYAESLKLAGARDFPWPMSMPLAKAGDLALGDMEKLIQYPTPQLTEFFKTKRLDRDALAAALPEIRRIRNRAFHKGSYTPDEGRELRDRWLGIERADGGIFGLLRPRA